MPYRDLAFSTIALAEQGSMLRPGSSFYMNKIVVPQQAKEAIDIRRSPTENLKNIAGYLNKEIGALTVCVMDRPRHEAFIRELRERILLIFHGDVAYPISCLARHRCRCADGHRRHTQPEQEINRGGFYPSQTLNFSQTKRIM